LLFFFVIVKLFTPALEDFIRNLAENSENETIGFSLSDSTDKTDKEKFNYKVIEGVEEDSTDKDEIYYDSTSEKLMEKFQQRQATLKDSISEIIARITKGELNDSTFNIDSLKSLVEDSTALAETMQLFDKEGNKKNNSLRRFLRLIQDRSMTPEMLLDSIENEKNPRNIGVAARILKIGRNDPAIFLSNIINNIGTLMFFTLPLLALFFVPLYIRRQKYYIDHLIFTLHLQAFTFVILTLAALFFHWELYSISSIFSLLLIIYVWFAFKKVYNQGFFKTSIKATIISSLYIMTLIFMLSINLLYSFYMF